MLTDSEIIQNARRQAFSRDESWEQLTAAAERLLVLAEARVIVVGAGDTLVIESERLLPEAVIKRIRDQFAETTGRKAIVLCGVRVGAIVKPSDGHT